MLKVIDVLEVEGRGRVAVCHVEGEKDVPEIGAEIVVEGSQYRVAGTEVQRASYGVQPRIGVWLGRSADRN